MLTEKPLTRREKWDAYKAAQRAERAARKGGGGATVGAHGLFDLVPGIRKVNARADHRAARRPARKQGGRAARHVDLGVFNINTGQREPLPRPVTE